METLRESQPAQAAFGQLGTRVDRYTLVKRLGAGGMAEVYEAEDPKLERHIALKLLKGSAYEDPRVTARLLDEARAMAKVSHPNVVAVFDAGVAGGQPWVAMEWIRGVTLRAWLRGRHSWAEKLRVLGDAGRGLLAAHQAGLVHRDFKPDNVLVGDSGRVAVSDFGLAHAATREVPDPSTEPPAERVVAGTPGYLAPEQYRFEPVDPRTDQFAFAVTAYEALFGGLPYVASRHDVSPLQAAQLALQVGAPRPPPSSPVPSRVCRALERGLQVQRESRFPSLEPLLAELEGALPRRGRVAAAAVSGALALLVAGGTWFAARPRTCDGGSALVAGAWNPQRREAVRAALTASSVPLGAAIAPQLGDRLDIYAVRWAAMYREACLATQEGHQSAQLLDVRNACLRRKLGELDALTAALAKNGATLADRAEKAVDALEDVSACAQATSLLERPPVPKAQAAAVEAEEREIAAVKAQEDLGQYRDALQPAKTAVAHARALSYPPVLAEALVELGRTQNLSGSPNDAVPTYDEAVNVSEVARDDRLRARARMFRVQLLIDLSRLDDAQREWDAAEAVVQRTGDPVLERDAQGLAADLDTAQGKFEQATQIAKVALEAAEQASPPDERRVVGALGTYAFSLVRMKKMSEAAAQYERAIPLAERVLGAHNPGLAKLTGVYTTVVAKLHRLEEARRYHQRTVDIITASLGPSSEMMGTDLTNWGMALLANHETAEARDVLEAAVVIRRKTHAPTDPELGQTLNGLAVVEAQLGNYAKAAAGFEEAERIHEKALGPTHPKVLGDLSDVAEAYSLAGQHRKALDQIDEVLRRVDAAGPAQASPSDRGRFVLNRAEELFDLGRIEEARKALAQSHDAAMQSDEAGLRSRQLFLEAQVAWDGAGDAATALRLGREMRPDVVKSNDRDMLRELDRMMARVKAGKREAPPPATE